MSHIPYTSRLVDTDAAGTRPLQPWIPPRPLHSPLVTSLDTAPCNTPGTRQESILEDNMIIVCRNDTMDKVRLALP